MLGWIVALVLLLVAGWQMLRAVREVGGLRLELEAARERIASLEIELARRAAPPLDHAAASRVLEGVSGIIDAD